MRTKKDNTPSLAEAWGEIVNNNLIPEEVFQEALKEERHFRHDLYKLVNDIRE